MSPVDLIQRLREFAKATCETVTAENGEQLTYEDSIIWLAADTLAAKDAALSDLAAENERLRKALNEARSDVHSLCSIGDGLVGWIGTAEATDNVAKWQEAVIRCAARATNQNADLAVKQHVDAYRALGPLLDEGAKR